MKNRSYYWFCAVGGLNIGCAVSESWQHRSVLLIATSLVAGIVCLFVAKSK